MDGLELWKLDATAIRQFPLKACADAIEAQMTRKLTHNLPLTSRSNMRDLISELRQHANLQLEHPPTRQMTLVIAAISKRTGFYAKDVLGPNRMEGIYSLRSSRFGSLPKVQQQAVERVEGALNLLARDLKHLRMHQPDAPRAAGKPVLKGLPGQRKSSGRIRSSAPLRLI